MSAIFKIKVTGLRTKTINGIENSVKQVDWILQGEQEGKSFELPQSTTVADPVAEGFIPLQDLTESEVVNWIEENFDNMEAVKAHVQYVLDREVATGTLTSTAMPWVVEVPAVTPEV